MRWEVNVGEGVLPYFCLLSSRAFCHMTHRIWEPPWLESLLWVYPAVKSNFFFGITSVKFLNLTITEQKLTSSET